MTKPIRVGVKGTIEEHLEVAVVSSRETIISMLQQHSLSMLVPSLHRGEFRGGGFQQGKYNQHAVAAQPQHAHAQPLPLPPLAMAYQELRRDSSSISTRSSGMQNNSCPLLAKDVVVLPTRSVIAIMDNDSTIFCGHGGRGVARGGQQHQGGSPTLNLTALLGHQLEGILETLSSY